MKINNKKKRKKSQIKKENKPNQPKKIKINMQYHQAPNKIQKKKTMIIKKKMKVIIQIQIIIMK